MHQCRCKFKEFYALREEDLFSQTALCEAELQCFDFKWLGSVTSTPFLSSSGNCCEMDFSSCQDLTNAPIHLTVLGSPTNPDTTALHTAALRSITSHELIELRDPSDPSTSPTSIKYPQLDRAALFLCSASACSSPVFHPEDVRGKVERAQRLSPQ
jgi:hypothetical protein